MRKFKFTSRHNLTAYIEASNLFEAVSLWLFINRAWGFSNLIENLVSIVEE